jgi:hypothetical protein
MHRERRATVSALRPEAAVGTQITVGIKLDFTFGTRNLHGFKHERSCENLWVFEVAPLLQKSLGLQFAIFFMQLWGSHPPQYASKRHRSQSSYALPSNSV